MRVLHLTTEFPPIVYGGLGTAVGALVRASSQAGVEVAVLLVGTGGDPSYVQPAFVRKRPRSEASIESPAGVHLFPVSHADAEALGLRLVEAWRPDVIHLHVFWLWPLARTIRVRTGIRLVYTVHSLDRAEYELGQGPLECLSQWETQADLISSADLVVALTCDERVLLTEYCAIARERIRVVGNGIEDSDAARAAALQRRHNDAPLILFTGRFVDRKGVKELLSAAALVLKSIPSARFVLAGGHRHCDGASMAEYWMPPELAPHRDRVHFTGWLSAEELAFWYRKADVLAVPSWYEPFGMVVLEGMLYGLAIVASNIGGPAEILEHGRTALLVPPRDATVLADELIKLIAAPRVRRRLGLTAARAVRREWLYSRVVQKMKFVYAEAYALGQFSEGPGRTARR